MKRSCGFVFLEEHFTAIVNFLLLEANVILTQDLYPRVNFYSDGNRLENNAPIHVAQKFTEWFNK